MVARGLFVLAGRGLTTLSSIPFIIASVVVGFIAVLGSASSPQSQGKEWKNSMLIVSGIAMFLLLWGLIPLILVWKYENVALAFLAIYVVLWTLSAIGGVIKAITGSKKETVDDEDDEDIVETVDDEGDEDVVAI